MESIDFNACDKLTLYFVTFKSEYYTDIIFKIGITSNIQERLLSLKQEYKITSHFKLILALQIKSNIIEPQMIDLFTKLYPHLKIQFYIKDTLKTECFTYHDDLVEYTQQHVKPFYTQTVSTPYFIENIIVEKYNDPIIQIWFEIISYNTLDSIINDTNQLLVQHNLSPIVYNKLTFQLNSSLYKFETFEQIIALAEQYNYETKLTKFLSYKELQSKYLFLFDFYKQVRQIWPEFIRITKKRKFDTLNTSSLIWISPVYGFKNINHNKFDYIIDTFTKSSLRSRQASCSSIVKPFKFYRDTYINFEFENVNSLTSADPDRINPAIVITNDNKCIYQFRNLHHLLDHANSSISSIDGFPFITQFYNASKSRLTYLKKLINECKL